MSDSEKDQSAVVQRFKAAVKACKSRGGIFGAGQGEQPTEEVEAFFAMMNLIHEHGEEVTVDGTLYRDALNENASDGRPLCLIEIYKGDTYLGSVGEYDPNDDLPDLGD